MEQMEQVIQQAYQKADEQKYNKEVFESNL